MFEEDQHCESAFDELVGQWYTESSTPIFAKLPSCSHDPFHRFCFNFD